MKFSLSMPFFSAIIACVLLAQRVSASCDKCPEKSYCTVYDSSVPGSHLLDAAINTYFTCQCREGYAGDGWRCQEIDECQLTDENYPCPSDELGGFCVNTDPNNEEYPRYKCGCSDGFVPSTTDEHGATSCMVPRITSFSSSPAPTISDEPTGSPSEPPTTSCTNDLDCPGRNKACFDGRCDCKVGYFSTNGPRSAHCFDEDECQTGYPNNCHRFATCTNTEGSYRCVCKEGWADSSDSVAPGSSCVNVDECREGTHSCLEGQVCIDRLPPHFYECVDRTPQPTREPTRAPTRPPTQASTPAPTPAPTAGSPQPTPNPTLRPTEPPSTAQPTFGPVYILQYPI